MRLRLQLNKAAVCSQEAQPDPGQLRQYFVAYTNATVRAAPHFGGGGSGGRLFHPALLFSKGLLQDPGGTALKALGVAGAFRSAGAALKRVALLQGTDLTKGIR